MSETQRTCFVIMPFRPELYYFYLFLKQHLEQKHGLKCERGDHQVLTQPIIEKIKESILKADLLIADCSGRNPNVFYELGLAHAYNKKVILITHDPTEDAPTDVRHYEFIRYDQHLEFLKKLDNAIQNVFAPQYDALYEIAKSVFTEFRQATHVQAVQASQQEFEKRVKADDDEGKLPTGDKEIEVARFVLPKIVANIQDIDVMDQITDWLRAKLKTE